MDRSTIEGGQPQPLQNTGRLKISIIRVYKITMANDENGLFMPEI